MFLKPAYGWSGIEIEGFRGRGSYLTDIPMECLSSFINAFEDGVPFSVYINEEGSDFTVVANWTDTYIIVNRDNYDLISLDINFKDLAKEMVSDFEKYFDDWVLWSDSCIEEHERDEECLEIRRFVLREKIDRLKHLIEYNGKIDDTVGIKLSCECCGSSNIDIVKDFNEDRFNEVVTCLECNLCGIKVKNK